MVAKLDKFTDARKKLISAIQAFPKESRTTVLFGTWNLKDVVAHFAAWDMFFANCAKLLVSDKEVPYWGKISDFNNREVLKRSSKSWEAVYTEFLESGEEFIKTYQSLPEKLLKKSFWVGKKYTPESLLEINVDHYLRAQLKDIEKLTTKLNK